MRMDSSEKIEMVKALVNDSSVTDEVITVYLKLAEGKIMERAYPYGDVFSHDMPIRYERLQCELASRYIVRRGVEGQTVSIENGVHRTYGTPNDEDLLCEVMQVVGTL